MAATVEKEDVYCTLVMTDSYLPGAAVLAHSLRDSGTQKKLACLIVQDSLRESTIQELRSLYNYVIPVERIGNPNPANLYLMNRPDLLYTFTKVHLWSQTQFRKIVYIDSDAFALRAPEELFDIRDAFAAAPDVGWPDAFNTGVMVISPHLGDYQALKGLAGVGDSFDGGDQGLLNQYYEHRPWRRIGFTYNTTPSANYQYEPAYRYFKRDISLVHFIGDGKPWQRGRTASGAPGGFQEMLSKWWAVYDRHLMVSTTDYMHGQHGTIAAYVTHGHTKQHDQSYESYSATGYPVETTGPAPPPQRLSHGLSSHSQHLVRNANLSTYKPGSGVESDTRGHVEPASTVTHQGFSAPRIEWDATRGAPPVESRPEAINFPDQTYEFNTNPALFRPPRSYPDPPKDLWYSVPEKPKVEQRPKPIFPWEERKSLRPTRRFIEDEPISPPLELASEPYTDELEVTSDSKVEPVTSTIQVHDIDHWPPLTTNKNAWDDVPGIENYVRALTAFRNNRGQVQSIQIDSPSYARLPSDKEVPELLNESDATELVEQVRRRRESLILTDFPSAAERPSLPVTPAPRRRPTFWGAERDNDRDLPPAEGVPEQADWDPSAQLEQLRRISLIGSADLKLPSKTLGRREMPPTAFPMPEHALSHLHSTLADRDGTSDISPPQYGILSGAASPHGLDTVLNTAINSNQPLSSSQISATSAVQSGAATADELGMKVADHVFEDAPFSA